MAYLAMCGIIAFLTGITCSFIVFFSKPRNAVKIMWSLYSLGIALWGLGAYKLFTASTYDVALFWGRMINLFGVLIPIYFFHFVLHFTNRMEEKKFELPFYYAIIIAYIGFAIFNPSCFISSVSPKGGFLFYPDAGRYYGIFPIIFFYWMIYGLILLYDGQNKVSALRRNQFAYLFYASLIGMAGGSTLFFLVFNIPIFPYGAIVVPLYSLAVAYAIVKHELLDIQVVMRKGLVYTIVLSILTLFYLMAIYFLERISHQFFGYNELYVQMAAFIFMAALGIPLKNAVQAFIAKNFFKVSYQQLVDQNDLLRQQVLRAQRYQTMSTLSQNILLELKAPLNNLSTYGEELPKRLNEKDYLIQFNEVFQKEIGRIQVLIKRLSEFSDPQPLNLQTVDIVALINEALARIEEAAKEKHITVYKYFPENKQIKIPVDAGQLREAILYFLWTALNSIVDEGGQIWVGIEMPDGCVEIRIKDTGQGFTNDQVNRLFDPLNSDKNNLPLAQTIISNHGGKVIVESEPTIGTEWIIQLPR